jgi:hypothetical protein
MQMRRLIVLALVPLALAACGGGDDEEQRPQSAQACPEGTPSLQARDVIGSTPEGYIVDRGDQQAIGEIAGRISDSVGSTMRDYDGRVLARRGASAGTVVLVVNATKRSPTSEELIGSMTANEEKLGLSGENITVGGTEGRLSTAVDGSYVATAPAGECAIVMLIDEREKRLRDVATLVSNEG